MTIVTICMRGRERETALAEEGGDGGKQEVAVVQYGCAIERRERQKHVDID